MLQETPLSQWWRFFTTRTNPIEYLPLRDLSYRVDLALFGLQPWGFRLDNLLLYTLTCAAVWWFVVALLPALRGHTQPEDRWVAAVTAALFAAHPAHVESMAWVSGRKDLLSGLFAVMSLVAFTRAVSGPRPSWWRLSGSCLLRVRHPFQVHGGRSTGRGVDHRAGAPGAEQPVVAGRAARHCVGHAALRALRRLSRPPGLGVNDVCDGAVRWRGVSVARRSGAAAVRILGTLARIAAFPVHPRLIYDVEAPGHVLTLVSLLGIVAIGATLLGSWLVVRHRSPVALGLAMVGILLAPFLQLIPFYTWSYASDRFLFLPVIGLSLAVL